MRKSLSLCLVLALLLTALAACGQQTPLTPTETDPPVPTVAIDLREYTIVRPDSASTTLVSAVSRFKLSLDEDFGIKTELTTDWVKKGAEIDPEDACEILIGLTNRPQSAEVHATISGIGYAIVQTGNKLVITATSDDAIAAAIDDFYASYVVGATGPVLEVPEGLRKLSEPLEALDVIKDGRSLYTIVRAEDCNKSMLEAVQGLRTAVEDISGVAPSLDTDWVKKGASPDSAKREILVGDTNRPETAQVKAELGPNGYAVRVVGQKIVIVGSSMTGTLKAIDAFVDLLRGAVGVRVDGKANVTLLASASRSGKENNLWVTDIPAFTGGSYYGTHDANSDTYAAYYPGATLADLEAYAKALEADGFVLHDRSSLAGNVSFTYVKQGHAIVHAYFVKHLEAVRVVVSPTGNGLPPVTSAADAPVTEPSITQLVIDYNPQAFGMGYIITNADGSFVIIDGGNRMGSNATVLHQTLQSLNRRAGTPVIAAWILTHVHGDHYSNFQDFAQTYGDQYILEYAIHNAPNRTFAYSDGYESFFENSFMAVAGAFVGNTTVVKAHTGMRFNLRGAEFAVLYTQEDLYPAAVDHINDTTLVTRMTLGGQTVLWLGDLQVEGSEIMAAMYGEALASDMVQVAHHAVSNGGTDALYAFINPKIALWPCPESMFNTARNQRSPAGNLYKSPTVLEHIVAIDQTRTITLPYTPK